MPDGFEFAPKLPGRRLRGLDEFAARVRLLGGSLGPVRVSLKNARDEGLLELLLGSLDPGLRLAFDLEHPSWDGIEERLAAAGAVRVNDLDHPAPFRYLRLREPPYDDDALRALAARVRDVREPVYVYFRHEDAPTAPAYAERLLALISSRSALAPGATALVAVRAQDRGLLRLERDVGRVARVERCSAGTIFATSGVTPGPSAKRRYFSPVPGPRLAVCPGGYL